MVQIPFSPAAVHPLVAHSLVVLLFTAPLLLIVGMGTAPQRRQLFFRLALFTMALGTFAAIVAFLTGHMALQNITLTPALSQAASKHRTFAEVTIELFTILTVGFAALFFAPKIRRLDSGTYVRPPLLAIFLLFYGSAALFLAHTAVQGTELARQTSTKSVAVCPSLGGEKIR